MGRLAVNRGMHRSAPGLGEVADSGLDDLAAFNGGSTLEFSPKIVTVLSHEQGFVEVFSM